MYKYILSFLVFFLLSCSSSRKEENIITVTVLRGPSAIAFAQWMANPPTINGKMVRIEIVDSPELMQARLVQEKAGIAVLPMINAANLYTKGLPYRLTGCPIWGNLYLVEKESPEKDLNRTLHIFGAGTTPDILTRFYLHNREESYSLNYSFSTIQEILQGFLTGKVERAVMAEPFLSMLLTRGNEFRIIADLNYAEGLFSGFPQTAILLHPSFQNEQEDINRLLHESALFANNYPEKTIGILEKEEIFPVGLLTPESIERCKIQYIQAEKAKENIYGFLHIIYEYEPKAIGGVIPDNNFIISGE